MRNAIDLAESGQCPGLGRVEVEGWISALEANPLAGGRTLDAAAVAPLRAQLDLAENKPDDALRQLDLALAASATPDRAAVQASMLASKGYYRQALAHLDHYDALPKRVSRPGDGMAWLHQWILERQGYWPNEFAVLRAKLREEIAKAPLAPEAAQRQP
jgi:hypothetical protein